MLMQDEHNSCPSNSIIGKKSDEKSHTKIAKITYQSLIEAVKCFQ